MKPKSNNKPFVVNGRIVCAPSYEQAARIRPHPMVPAGAKPHPMIPHSDEPRETGENTEATQKELDRLVRQTQPRGGMLESAYQEDGDAILEPIAKTKEAGGLSPELDEVERNRREDEKERIEKEWYENERSRAATADNYWNEDLDE